jgi:archaellum component FlaG (FlaF/FlaG flagellin family)
MTNKKNWLGILAAALVFGLTVAGCDDDSTNTRKYTGKDRAGNEYTITLENNTARSAVKNSRYTMKIKNSGGKTIGSNNGTVTDVLDDTEADTITLQSSDGSESTVTLSNDGVISSIVGNITLADGTIFTVRTFDAIYMRMCRFNDIKNSGQQYYSGHSIKLKDVYDGNFDDLIPESGEYKVRLTGAIDKRLSNVCIKIFYVIKNWRDTWSTYNTNYEHVAMSSYDNFSDIKPYGFSTEIGIKKVDWVDFDINTFPEGEYVLQIEHMIYDKDNNWNEKIPDNIPDGTIMATIRNLIIEPAE